MKELIIDHCLQNVKMVGRKQQGLIWLFQKETLVVVHFSF